jgi:CRISPR/Cas system-associated protein Cas5 (RAMP superfamily)
MADESNVNNWSEILREKLRSKELSETLKVSDFLNLIFETEEELFTLRLGKPISDQSEEINKLEQELFKKTN